MHECLCKADAGLSLYSDLLSKTTEEVKQTLLKLGPHFKEMTTRQLDEFYQTLPGIPPELGDYIKGNACVNRGTVEQRLSSANNAVKTKGESGLELSVVDWANWLDAAREFVRCYLEGLENTIVSKP